MWWGGKEIDWEFGISTGKLLYIKWINNKVLLYSTGKLIQYPVINHNGKEYEKYCVYICLYLYIYTHIYVTESLCCTVEINIVNQL